jgi:hypothetical protein
MGDLLVQILEIVFNYPDRFDSDSVYVKAGIWSVSDFPYTYYALLIDGANDNMAIAGETSYGADSVDEALQCVLNELSEILAG